MTRWNDNDSTIRAVGSVKLPDGMTPEEAARLVAEADAQTFSQPPNTKD